jgi:hypothetical protein
MHRLFVYTWFYLWIAPHVLLGAIVFFLHTRRLRPRFPLFFVFCVFELLYFLAGFASYIRWSVLHPGRVSGFYYGVLIVGFALSALLEFVALYEIADKLILSNSYLSKSLRPLLRWTAATALLVAVAASALLSRPDLARIISVFQTLAFSANLIKIGLLFALLLFTGALGLSWRSLPAGIALGFGISAAAELGASALLSELGRSGYLSMDLIRMASFHICVVVWLVYVLLPEKPKSLETSTEQLSEIELRMQELQRIVR